MSRVIGLVALAILAVVGIAGVQAALVETGDQTSISEEEWAPDPGNYTTLSSSSIDGATYGANPTVKNSSGVIVQQGEDYEWNRSGGRIKAIAGEGLDDGGNATISYSYSVPTAEQQQLASVTGSSFNIAGFFLLVLGAGMVLSMLGVLSRL